ncbi:phosphatase PAP2 family protein [Cellulomonas sp. P24]|uniref:phosphatase PAP2 family protein n=1 Tax=Cellulomonas sp. P24 TaxID=2885206 RepID=UPI00216B3B07|nr:phosphatase PAP2 family protein [Cellulomonas sp. P24]MCR6494529.1 phosphatase PAP2 family protein [Cellulomonas sp. P24]
MDLTEFDDIGEVLLLSFCGIMALVFAAVVAELRLAQFIKDPTASPRPRRSARSAPARRRALLRAVAAMRPGRRVLTVAWKLVTTATVVLTVVVMTGATLRFDARTLPWFTWLDHTEIGHGVARILVMGGQFWLAGSVVVLLAVYRSIQARNLRPAAVTGAAIMTMSVSLWLVKVLVGRTAPHSGANEVLDGGMSFPSGHAATATVCLLLGVALGAGPAQVLSRRGRAMFGAASAGSAVVGVCTVVLGYHWLSDAVAGWMIGVVIALPAIRWLVPAP